MSAKQRFAAMAAACCFGWGALGAGAGPCEGNAQQKCFVGDRLCAHDAFDFAKEMLGSNHWDSLRGKDLLLVATGTIEEVHGLPESLDVEREVRATFAIERLYRYQAEHNVPDWVGAAFPAEVINTIPCPTPPDPIDICSALTATGIIAGAHAFISGETAANHNRQGRPWMANGALARGRWSGVVALLAGLAAAACSD